MVRGFGPAGKALTQPLAGWGEGHGDENYRVPHFLACLSILAWFGHLTSFSQESVLGGAQKG